MTARIPEPQTLLTVTQGTVSGMPAPSDAWRAGAWPIAGLEDVAHDDLLDLRRPARRRARAPPRIAAEPSAGAGSEESLPRNEPIGVRAAERMTRFFIGGDSNAGDA